MIHYLSKAKHITCSAKDGKRLSPVRSLAYDSGLALHDRERDKDFSQKHNDGTEIISTEICNYQDCKYTDKSVPIEKRLSDIANDLYDQNRSLKERLLVKFVFALPSGLNDKQLIFLTRKIGEIYSQQFNRPIILAIHKKRRNGVLNCHCHMSIPERALDKDDNWKQKRTKIYMDTNGNLIRDKQYYDADTGWDIRRPIIDMSLVPRDKAGKIKEDEIYARDPVTGNYLYQQREARNRRKWDCKTHMGKWLENNDIVQMHDNLDFAMNEFFRENNIDDRVVRRDNEATSLVKKAGIRYAKIGPNASAVHKNKVLRNNARYNAYADAIEEVLIKERALSAEAEFAEDMDRRSTRTINTLHVQEMQLQEKLTKMETENPIPAYVNNVLRPQKIFTNEAVDRYNNYLSMKRKIAQPLLDSLDLGVQATQSAIAGINGNADATERDMARAKFLSKNVSLMIRLRGAVYGIAQTDFGKKVRSNATRKWNRLSVRARCHYIKSRCGDEDALIYQEHHKLTGKTSDDEKSVPEPIHVPDMEKLEKRCLAVANAWSSTVRSGNHIPPADIGILSEILSAEATITETMPEEIFALPDGKEYASATEANRREYEAELAEITQREAEAERIRLEEERRRQEEAERKCRLEEQRRQEQILAEQERIRKERLAEQERIRRQELAERKRREEQKRIAEARLAEQKRLEEKRRQEEELAEKRRLEEEAERKRLAERERKKAGNRQPVPGNVTAPPRQPQRQDVASAKGKTGGTVAPRYTKADYYELSDRANIFKLFTVIDTARKALADGTKTFSSILDGIEYYTKHSKHFDRDRKAYGIDFSQYEKIQTAMKQIWVIVKDQEYERPAMINQKPQNYLTVDQCKTEENHLTQLMQNAQKEKARLMPVVIEKSVAEYINQENSRRRKYNAQHVGEKDFVRQPSIGFDEAGKELRKLYAERTDIFIADAIGHRVDIATFTNLVSEADSLQTVLDDNYIYHTLEDRQRRLQSKKAPPRTNDLEHTQSR
jgi:hypothetical protein